MKHKAKATTGEITWKDCSECKKEIAIKIRDEVIPIIRDSKATFFVCKGQKARIPKAEAMYELKSEILTNCETYFYKLLNPNDKI